MRYFVACGQGEREVQARAAQVGRGSGPLCKRFASMRKKRQAWLAADRRPSGSAITRTRGRDVPRASLASEAGRSWVYSRAGESVDDVSDALAGGGTEVVHGRVEGRQVVRYGVAPQPVRARSRPLVRRRRAGHRCRRRTASPMCRARRSPVASPPSAELPSFRPRRVATALPRWHRTARPGGKRRSFRMGDGRNGGGIRPRVRNRNQGFTSEIECESSFGPFASFDSFVPIGTFRPGRVSDQQYGPCPDQRSCSEWFVVFVYC